MGIYDFECEKCKHIFEKMIPESERIFVKNSPCPKCKESNCISQVILSAPGIGDPFQLGRIKPSSQFRERLNNILKVNKSPQKNRWS